MKEISTCVPNSFCKRAQTFLRLILQQSGLHLVLPLSKAGLRLSRMLGHFQIRGLSYRPTPQISFSE